jgi:cystathionine beta-lyase
MQYDFANIINRKNSNAYKWDFFDPKYKNDDIIHLSIADSDLPVPPQIINYLKKRITHPIFGYTIKSDRYFESISNWLKIKHNWEIKKDWIASSPGIVPAINLAIQSLTNEGDNIIIQPPVYAPFYDAIEQNKRNLLTNNLIEKNINNKIEYFIDFNDFEEKAKKAKLFIFCSPHNPVGRVWTREELTKIGFLCKKYKLFVICDEIHHDIIYEPFEHTCFSSIDDFSDFTITCLAPSKTFNIAGFYSSVIIIPNVEILKKFENALLKVGLIIRNCNLTNPVFNAELVEICYNDCDEWLTQLLLYLKKNRDFLMDFISTEIPLLQINDCQATFLSWINFNSLKLSHEQLIEFLLNKAKIGLDTGLKYGRNCSGYMRLNFSCSKIVLEKALYQLKNAVAEL